MVAEPSGAQGADKTAMLTQPDPNICRGRGESKKRSFWVLGPSFLILGTVLHEGFKASWEDTLAHIPRLQPQPHSLHQQLSLGHPSV